ncbi:unnamed protein product [Ranitomeya imitator]|uniref:Uncharacterized protein n=1 Tax=Ranitomeya imitator TaxID=111125 RepID=A0ABN9M1F9_9NEOB|nr:unnamed protein product [Ranitomeya imitator]
MDCFVATAEKYVLAGKPLAELCDHNAKVARELNRCRFSGFSLQVAQTWAMLGIIYCSAGNGPPRQSQPQPGQKRQLPAPPEQVD